jgi:GH25 family lysozyme M1 (1,4-beta-N-acetylmuramidase)
VTGAVALIVTCLSIVALAVPAGAFVTGVDVASWQHPGTTGSRCGDPINWVAVKNAGHSFAYVKATEATSYTNPCFAPDWQGAAAAGLYRGAYHYAKPALPVSTAADQARYFVSRTGSMTGPGDLPGFLDLEETGGLGQADLAQWTRVFLAEVTRLTGKAPMIYVGRYFWRDSVGNPADIGQQYRLWLPDYHCQRSDGSLFCDPGTDSYSPTGFAGWSSWTFWQNYSVGAVPGIVGGVDMNRFCCDIASLSALAGSGASGGSPFGSLDAPVMTAGDRATISGWAIDPDITGPIDVHVYVDGVGVATTANLPRFDVASAYPGFSGNHGYSISVPVPYGARTACAYGINQGAGSNTLLGCLSLGGSPSGYVDLMSVVAPGKVRIAGWAIDPNTAGPVPIHIYAGTQFNSTTANIYRDDLNSGFPTYGGNHAFDTVIDVAGGTQQVCVYAINTIGPGSNAALMCRTLNLPTGSPFGSVDVLAGRVGSIAIGGWVLDPDTADPTQAHVYVDGVGTAIVANAARSDVAAAYQGYGPNHGFNATIPAAAGAHQVCVYAINIAGSGANREMTCRTVQVMSPEPFGSADVVRGGVDSVTVAGWAIDPDTADPAQVHVYIDGVGTALVANDPRPDVAAAYQGYGVDHGFHATLPASPGTHQVCLYAINMAGGGSNQVMTCRTVNVLTGAPIGAIDLVGTAYGWIRIAGWAFDPETSAPIPVDVYVNGVGTRMTADQIRPEVGAFFGMGSNHGFDYARPAVGAGPQTVCAYAIGVGVGGNTALGCRVVTP